MAHFRSTTTIPLAAAMLVLCMGSLQAYGQSPKAARPHSQIPELTLDDALAKVDLSPENRIDMRDRLRSAIQSANELNKSKIDGFVEDLIKNRPDLKGLPFAMGDTCRMDKDRQRAFAIAGESTHHAIGHTRNAPQQRGVKMMETFQANFWTIDSREGGVVHPDGFTRTVAPGPLQLIFSAQKFAASKRSAPETASQTVAAAQVAALMQILGPQPAELRLALVHYLARMPHVEATRAIANLAIFSDEMDVRKAACEALESRNACEYTDLLTDGLNYPMPEVAQRASETITALKRKDMIPQLIAVLDRPEPGAPKVKDVDGKKVVEVREMVRINHHRNCLLCHAPGTTADVPTAAIKAPMPVPGERFPPSQNGGYESFGFNRDLVVRVDVSYLRQDFSRMMPVANPGAWPESQRFDFLVRTRALTDAEARAALAKLETPSDQVSPYHLAAAAALRNLTGRDAEPTAAAWRKAIGEK